MNRKHASVTESYTILGIEEVHFLLFVAETVTHIFV